MSRALLAGWDLTEIYPDDGAWRSALAAADSVVESLGRFKGGLQEAGRLADFLEAREELVELQSRTGSYASLHLALEPNDAHWLGLAAEAQRASQRARQALSFWEEELAALDPGTLPAWCAAEPRLAPYADLLRRMDQQARSRLSAEQESLLLQLAPVLGLPADIRQAVSRGVAFPPVDGRRLSVMAFAGDLGRSTDPGLRARAAEALRAGLAPHLPSLAAALAASVQRDVVLAKLRGFERAADLHLATQELGADHADAVVDGMLEDVAPQVRRYAELKRRVLRLDSFQLHDIGAPLDAGEEPGLDCGAAWEMMLAALAPEGPQVQAILQTARDGRWVEPRAPEAGGAMPFCAHVVGVHPYLMAPWQGRVSDLFATAHELGHAVHAALASGAQPPSLLSGGAAFFIEVPSRVHELLLGRHLATTAGDFGWRGAALLLDGLTGSIAATTLLAAVERDLFAIAESGRSVALDDIRRSHVTALRRLFGPVLDIDGYAETSWAMWPHIFSPTYPVSYPAGMCCAATVVEALQGQDPAASAAWTATLRLGGSVPARELMARAGSDLEQPGIARRFARHYGSLVDRVEAALT